MEKRRMRTVFEIVTLLVVCGIVLCDRAVGVLMRVPLFTILLLLFVFSHGRHESERTRETSWERGLCSPTWQSCCIGIYLL